MIERQLLLEGDGNVPEPESLQPQLQHRNELDEAVSSICTI
jgi:hypothetical protein